MYVCYFTCLCYNSACILKCLKSYLAITVNPLKTLYILQKSGPKQLPQNRYILKTVPGAKVLPQKTMYQQQKPTDKTARPRPHERKWGNDYETLQALDSNYLNTLSMHKKQALPDLSQGYAFSPILSLEHHEGVFTPNVDLSDGDISIDSGTGDSLDSDEDQGKGHMKSKYKHKPRALVREKLVSTKIPQKPPDRKVGKGGKSRLPQLGNSKFRAKPLLKGKLLSVESPPLSKSSPESLESRPIMTKPSPRHTLHLNKPARAAPTRIQPPKLPNDGHPLAPSKPIVVNKGVARKLPLGKVPRSIKQPKIAPRRQHVRVLESPSDSEVDELFKQMSTSQRTLPPKPSQRVDLQPTKPKRKYGIQYSLGRVK